VSVVASPAIAFPGEAIDVKAVVRDAALQPVSASASVRASITGTVDPGGALRLFPGAEVGTFGGALHAPREPGVYRVTVASDGGSATVPVIVAADARRAAPASRPLLDAWTTAHGGRLFSASEMNELSAAVRDAVRPPSRLVNWHPFRSIGWLGLFVLALSGEWWLRRRRGLR
jgi:hypothetical protein